MRVRRWEFRYALTTASNMVTSEVAVVLRCLISNRPRVDTTQRDIAHRKMPGSRRCIFVESEVNRWLGGETLEAIALENGGRIVRPAYSSSTPRHERKRSETKVTAIED